MNSVPYRLSCQVICPDILLVLHDTQVAVYLVDIVCHLGINTIRKFCLSTSECSQRGWKKMYAKTKTDQLGVANILGVNVDHIANLNNLELKIT